jgi:hypothetical protein
VNPFSVVLRLVPGWFCVKCLEETMFHVFYAFPRAHVYTRTTPSSSLTRAYRYGTHRTRGTKIICNTLWRSMSSRNVEQSWKRWPAVAN